MALSKRPNPDRRRLGIVTNRVEFTPGPPRNITALVLDELNTLPIDSARARAQVMRYLKAMAPQTRMAVYHMSGRLRVLHDFTDDAESLRARVHKAALALPLQAETDFDRAIIEGEQLVQMFSGDPQMQAQMEELVRTQLEVEMLANAAARRRRLELTLAAMDALGNHLAGVPGRKSLVWISGGISMLSVTGSMGMGPRGSIESFEQQVRNAARRLAQQGIVLYIVDARGLDLPESMKASSPGAMPVRGRGRFERLQDTERISADTHSAMNLMAAVTGGRHLFNTNDLTAGFRKAASDLLGSYTLGFYASEEPDNKWHALKVRVLRPGVSLHHRQGYLAETQSAAAADWTTERMLTAIASPVGSSAVLLTAQGEPVPGAEPGTIRIDLSIEAGSLQFHKDGEFLQAATEIVFGDRTADGKASLHRESGSVRFNEKHWETVRERGISHRRQWKPASDVVSVRVLVRDTSTGRYGTLDIPMRRILASRPSPP